MPAYSAALCFARRALSFALLTCALFAARSDERLAESSLVDIPDANFRAYLKENFAIAFVGDRLQTKHRAVQGYRGRINVIGKDIASLQGVEFFTSLTELLCSNNRLASLDVGHNPALTMLVCASNILTTLDVSHNDKLELLWCSDNRLEKLDVSRNKALNTLNCDRNLLTDLIISPSVALLDCRDNQLTTLDVSRNAGLTEFFCSKNQLATLDMSRNPALIRLYCDSNQLTSLNVSHNPLLVDLMCIINQLVALDVSHNVRLATLYCSKNQLTALDVSHNPNLTTFQSYFNPLLRSLDMRGMRAVIDLYIYEPALDDPRLLVALKVHSNLKNHAQMKALKEVRGAELKMSTYHALDGSVDYKETCADYDPTANGGAGACLH